MAEVGCFVMKAGGGRGTGAMVSLCAGRDLGIIGTADSCSPGFMDSQTIDASAWDF